MTNDVEPTAGQITIVGTGMTAIDHLTPEVRRALADADLVLYGVGDPATEAWLRAHTKTSESLVDDFTPLSSRLLAYGRMADRILAAARAGSRVCVAMYGHPSVFVFPTQVVLARARQEGIETRVLPNISSLDCLFVDLGVDPGATGIQIHDATTFLTMGPRIDARVPLVLCQLEVLGRADYDDRAHQRANLLLLQERLLSLYPPDHRVVGYDRSLLEGTAVTNQVRMDRLSEIGEFMTAYVPGVGLLEPDARVVEFLGLDRALEPLTFGSSGRSDSELLGSDQTVLGLDP